MFFYRGREGMWSWLLHRVAGISILVFLLVHVVDTALVLYGPKLYNEIMAIYRMPLFRIGEVLLAAAILFHALNGLRIIAIDFWPNGTRVHRQLFYAVAAVFLLLMIPVTYLMLSPVFGAGR